jgi:ATP sulfurylase
VLNNKCSHETVAQQTRNKLHRGSASAAAAQLPP